MQRKIRIRLLMIFTIALIVTATHSRATAQTSSANVLERPQPATVVASSGGETVPKLSADDVCEQRLLKTLDALEKAEKALSFALNEIDARKRLDDLKNELLKAKDQYIADVLADNKFLRDSKGSAKSRIRKVFETIEKILLVGAGVYLGRH